MGEIISLIDPVTTQNPVEVLIWVKPGVTQTNKNNALALIQQGLQSWEEIPTSHIAFTIVQVIESATEPDRLPHQLMIIVGNAANLTSGGASFPYNGKPGTWFGAVADSSSIDLVAVTTHEVGHAIGIAHTTVSEIFPEGTRPVMHWRIAGSSQYPTQDDIAAVSTAYPNLSNLLVNSTGTIKGRLIMQGSSTPVSGINVAVVDAATGNPLVARLSGPRISPYSDQNDGEFHLTGILPGDCIVRYLDGNSYRGSMVLIRFPSDGNTFAGMRGGFQADNFTEFQSEIITVTAGTVINLGDIEVAIEYIDFDTMVTGDLISNPVEIPVTRTLPNATFGVNHNIWLHIRGGLRDLTGTISGLPSGLTATISGDPRGHNAGVHGNHYLHIEGVPLTSGHYTMWARITDAAGRQRSFAFNLSVEPFETSGKVAEYHFNGNTIDSSGNNRHGQLIGTANFTQGRSGEEASAIEFDGHGYVQLIDEEAFDLPEFTVVIILKLDTPGSEDDWIISKGLRFGNFTLRRAGISHPWPGRGIYVHETFQGNWSSIISTDPLPTGEFFCLTVSVSQTLFKAYINGQLVRTLTNISPPLFNEGQVIIGGGGYHGISEYFRGVIDEVQIFRHALNDSEVSNLCSLTPSFQRYFRIFGKVIEIETGVGISGFRVNAFDKDRKIDDLLGEAITDEKGNFEIRYDREDFQEVFFDRRPDIYLTIKDRYGNLIHTTEDKVRYEANKTEKFVVKISRTKLKR